MGLLLGLVLFLYLLPNHEGMNPSVPPIEREVTNVEAFQPSRQILKKVRDATTADRSVINADAMQHLLKLALNVTPDIAEALQMPERQIPIDDLRAHPDRFRGHYLWFKGQLNHFEPTQTKHPIHGYKIYEGDLQVPRRDGTPDVVFFYVSKPADTDLKAGDFVRIEGYFMKLRDDHLLAKAEKGPLLIGRQLKRAYPDWQAVDQLDHSVLVRVENPIWKNDTWINDRDAWLGLPESENVPLWHLASFAMHQSSRITEEQKRQVPFFVDDKMLAEFKHGSRDQGTLVRIKGRFAYDFIHHEDRLTEPLIRGDDGELHPASWQEALTAAAEGLGRVKESHGADALGFVSSSRCTMEENYLMQKVARAAYGTNNVHQCAAT